MATSKRAPRFIAIVTPGKSKRYRVFDRITKHSYSGTDNRELAERLAREFSDLYTVTWYRRAFAWLFRLQLPEPTPDPAEEPIEPPEPEWKLRIRRINELIERRKQELARDDPYRQVSHARADLDLVH